MPWSHIPRRVRESRPTAFCEREHGRAHWDPPEGTGKPRGLECSRAGQPLRRVR